MTAVIRQFPWLHSTDAEFRTWVAGVIEGVTAVGMVQTADTGQINTTTVVKPAANTMAGYSIHRLFDTLQATAPVFMKVEYGSAPGSAASPSMFITYGSGTDGAGTLTGRVSNRVQAYASSSLTATTGVKNNYFFSNGSSFSMMLGTEFNVANSLFLVAFTCVERTLNQDGTPNNYGFYVIAASSGASNSSQCVPYSNILAIPSSTGVPSCIFPYGHFYTTGSDGADISFFPHTTATPRVHGAQRVVFGAYQNDLTKYSSIPLTVYGVVSTYVALGNLVNTMGGNGSASVSAASLVMRFD